MEGFIVLFLVAFFVLGIKWFVSYDKSTREDLYKDRLKREEGIKAGAKPFNREEAEAEAREYHKKKGQFQELEETFEYQMGERGGRYEIRYSKRTGKPYRHYF